MRIRQIAREEEQTIKNHVFELVSLALSHDNKDTLIQVHAKEKLKNEIMETVMLVAKNFCHFQSVDFDISTGLPENVPIDSIDAPIDNPSNNLVNDLVNDMSVMENTMDNVMDSSMDIPKTSQVPSINFELDKGKEIEGYADNQVSNKIKRNEHEPEWNIPSKVKEDNPAKEANVQVSILGTNSSSSEDVWKKIFSAPWTLPLITSSMQSVEFSNIDLVQKIEIGEAFISSTRQDFQKKDKIIEDLLATLHTAVPECQLDPNTPNVEKYKMLICPLGNHVEKIREKYEKDKVDDKEKLIGIQG